jgi:hypothetical protein
MTVVIILAQEKETQLQVISTVDKRALNGNLPASRCASAAKRSGPTEARRATPKGAMRGEGPSD